MVSAGVDEESVGRRSFSEEKEPKRLLSLGLTRRLGYGLRFTGFTALPQIL
jgi:hypothetical protein